MGAEFIGGFHAVQAALESKRSVSRVLLRRGRQDERSRQIRQLAQAHEVPVEELEQDALERLLPGLNHQGIAAEAEPARMLGESELDALVEIQTMPLLLALDQVQDPHNLGACLRSAAAAGCHGVILPRDRTAGLTAAARKVSAGGAEKVPVFQVTNLARSLRHLQKAGCWVVGTDGDAPDSLYAADLNMPLVLVMGGEAGGMRRLTRDTCDLLVRIPMTGAVESLNISVAAGVCLFEIARQRGL